LNIFRNLNQLFQWTFTEKLKYLLSYLTQIFLLRKYFQFSLKKKKFNKIVKYLDSLARRLDDYRINIQADPSLNFCRVLVSFDQMTPNRLLLHVPKMNNFLYYSSGHKESIDVFFKGLNYDLDTPKVRKFYANLDRLFSLTRLLSRHLCIDLMKVLLFNMKLLIADIRKELAFVSNNQLRLFYMAKLADRSALKFRFQSMDQCDDKTLFTLDEWLKFDWRKDMDCSFLILLVSNNNQNSIFKLDPTQLTNREKLKQSIRGNLFNEIIFKKIPSKSIFSKINRYVRVKGSLLQNWILRQTIYKYSIASVIFNLTLMCLLFIFEMTHFYFYIANYIKSKDPQIFIHVCLFMYICHQTIVTWIIILEQLGIYFSFCRSSMRQFIHESNFFIILFGIFMCCIFFTDKDHFDFYMPILFPSLIIFKIVRMNLLKTVYAMQNFKTLKLHLVKS
jgi:hypothetical protein